VANKVSYIIELREKFGAAARNIQRGFKNIENSAEKAAAKMHKFHLSQEKIKTAGQNMVKVGAVMTAAVTAPLLLMSRHAIKAASDAEETANKFNEVFKGIETQSAINELVGGYQLASSSAQELLSDTGDLLVGLGLTREQALSLSKDVVKLSADVASFKNVEGGTARASNALTKALLGEREMLKDTFKTAVLQEEVTKRAALIKRKDRSLTKKQAEAIAVLNIVTERNKDAIGDLARTSESYANVKRKEAESTKILAERYGKALLPAAVTLSKTIRKLADFMSEQSDETIRMIVLVGALAAALGPLIAIVGGMAILGAAISAPVWLAIGAIVALIAAVGTLWIYWDQITLKMGLAFMGVVATVKSALISVINFAIDALNQILIPLSTVTSALGIGSVKIPRIEANGASSGSLTGEITVSAAPGSKVEKTKLQTSGNGMSIGINMSAWGM